MVIVCLIFMLLKAWATWPSIATYTVTVSGWYWSVAIILSDKLDYDNAVSFCKYSHTCNECITAIICKYVFPSCGELPVLLFVVYMKVENVTGSGAEKAS